MNEEIKSLDALKEAVGEVTAALKWSGGYVWACKITMGMFNLIL